MRVVFMGNPEFAVPTLKLLQKSKHKILAVVSNAPKQMGRGREYQSTPVGKYAKENNMKLLEPTNLNDQKFIKELKKMKADIFIVVAYRILPKEIIKIPIHGAVNLHVSLLPKYRGPAPIQWALMNGDKETGVTIFQISDRVDTGDILVQEKHPIYDKDNMLTLGTRLCNLGANIITNTIDKIENGSIKSVKQNRKVATFAPKITKEMRSINWNWPSIKIHNWVRGLSPFPSMFTIFNGKILKVFKTFAENGPKCKPGVVFQINKDSILIGTGDGLLGLLEVQLEGRKKLFIKDFLRGSLIRKNSVFGK